MREGKEARVTACAYGEMEGGIDGRGLGGGEVMVDEVVCGEKRS